MQAPTLLIIDLKEILTELLKFKYFHNIFKYYPLQDIIHGFLSQRPDRFDEELLWLDFQNRIDASDDNVDQFDFYLVSLAFTTIANLIDNYLEYRLKDLDPLNYLFVRWLDNSSIILQYENLYDQWD